MNIAFLTDSYMSRREGPLLLDPYRKGVVDVLRRLGHSVQPFVVNGTYLEERSAKALGADGDVRLARDVAATRPDLILSINRAGLCPAVLELKGPRFASWYIDNVHTFPPDLLQFHEKEFVFFFGPRAAREAGGAPASLPMERRFYLPLGVDSQVFCSRKDVLAQVPDRLNILFLGGFFSSKLLWKMSIGRNPAFYNALWQLYLEAPTITSYAQFLQLLKLYGFEEQDEMELRGLLRALQSAYTGQNRVRKLESVMDLGLTLYGSGWEAMIPEHFKLLTCYSGQSITDANVMAGILSLSRMTVNITHCQSRLCGGLNLRVFEAMSCGTLLINDYPDELGTLFKNGEHFLGYRSDEELRVHCQWAIDNPEEAAKIAEAGRRAVLDGHTLQHRLSELLEVVEGG